MHCTNCGQHLRQHR